MNIKRIQKTDLKIWALFLGLLSWVGALGCSSSSSTSTKSSSITLTANGLHALSTSSFFTELQIRSFLKILSVGSPDFTAGEYYGMGVNAGDAQVDGLKIRLTGIQTGIGAFGQGGAVFTLFDWSSSPKVLEIADGFNQPISDVSTTALSAGSYSWMSVGMQDNYDLKAYALLDSQNSGTVDTLIYTTASGVKSVLIASLSSALPTMPTDYDYFHYGFMNAYTADSVTSSSKTNSVLTIFPTPVTIKSSSDLPNISLLIDSYHLVAAWDGRTGSATLPQLSATTTASAQCSGASVFCAAQNGLTHGLPIPYGPFTSSASSNTIPISTFFPTSEPNFAITNYLRIFALPSSSTVTSQTYVISASGAPNDLFNNDIFTIIYDSSGTPLLGRGTANTGYLSPHLGQVGKIFEQQADTTYTFYSEYGIDNPTTGVDDGGLYYSNDKTMAGYSVNGFSALSAVGDSGTLYLKDGPRCHSDSGSRNDCLSNAGNTDGLSDDQIMVPGLGWTSTTVSVDTDGLNKRTLNYYRVK